MMHVFGPGLTFFFNATATTEIYTLSLHDALPISRGGRAARAHRGRGHRQLGQDLHEGPPRRRARAAGPHGGDRKSTRLNSSHSSISYAVFCLKKKNHATFHEFGTVIDVHIDSDTD